MNRTSQQLRGGVASWLADVPLPRPDLSTIPLVGKYTVSDDIAPRRSFDNDWRRPDVGAQRYGGAVPKIGNAREPKKTTRFEAADTSRGPVLLAQSAPQTTGFTPSVDTIYFLKTVQGTRLQQPPPRYYPL